MRKNTRQIKYRTFHNSISYEMRRSHWPHSLLLLLNVIHMGKMCVSVWAATVANRRRMLRLLPLYTIKKNVLASETNREPRARAIISPEHISLVFCCCFWVCRIVVGALQHLILLCKLIKNTNQKHTEKMCVNRIYARRTETHHIEIWIWSWCVCVCVAGTYMHGIWQEEPRAAAAATALQLHTNVVATAYVRRVYIDIPI